jgi:NAD(P)-dependent dehydrogenase (short-subunit alcohol dehydrogenase family)
VIDLSLKDKVAVVTGGSKGLGKAIADVFAEAGAAVTLAARNEDEVSAAATDIEQRGGRALAVRTDVTDPRQVERLVARTVEEFGTIDILVNNAGAAPFLMSVGGRRGLDRFEKYLELNFLGAVHCTHAAAPHLQARRGSCVLNVASVAGFTASKGLPYYGAAKAAMISFTRTTAREWAPAVRVNALAPGIVATDIYRPTRVVVDPHSLTGRIPLGRLGEPADVAAAALYLCSPAASFVTGSVLVVDGGQSIGMIRSP